MRRGEPPKRHDRAHLGIEEFGIMKGVDEVLGRWVCSLTAKFVRSVAQWMNERRKEGEGARATKTLSQCNATLCSGKQG